VREAVADAKQLPDKQKLFSGFHGMKSALPEEFF